MAARGRLNGHASRRWNKNGQFVELRVPPKGDPIWRELHALQEKAAGGPVPFMEELNFWEGPAASQVYEKQLPDGNKVPDDWHLPGGVGREPMGVLRFAVGSSYGMTVWQWDEQQ